MADEKSELLKLPTKRAKNFEEKETSLLLDLFQEHRDLLRSKHNNMVTQNKKKAVMQLITDKVNALGVCQRTVQQIKNKWTNIVGDGKEKDAQLKKSHGKTGVGPPCSPPTATQEKVICMMSETPGFSRLDGNLESECFSGKRMPALKKGSILYKKGLSVEQRNENIKKSSLYRTNEHHKRPCNVNKKSSVYVYIQCVLTAPGKKKKKHAASVKSIYLLPYWTTFSAVLLCTTC